MSESTPNRTAIFPGSFDPLTLGHLDVVGRAAPLFDRLILGVLDNPEKSALFPAETRLSLVRAEIAGLENVEARAFAGLVVDFATRVGARWILRGVRSASDVAYELPMAHSNRLCGGEVIETVLVPTRPELAFISSSLVRQIAAGGGELDHFVPKTVEQALRKRFSRE